MKSPDEIKKGLECYVRMSDNTCPPRCMGNECDLYTGDYLMTTNALDALTYIQQLEAAQPKWISVKERLPEDDVSVLVHALYKNEESVIAMTSYTHHMHGYNIEGWRTPWQYFFYDHEITHWMPLPEPPEEDDLK